MLKIIQIAFFIVQIFIRSYEIFIRSSISTFSCWLLKMMLSFSYIFGIVLSYEIDAYVNSINAKKTKQSRERGCIQSE